MNETTYYLRDFDQVDEKRPQLSDFLIDEKVLDAINTLIDWQKHTGAELRFSWLAPRATTRFLSARPASLLVGIKNVSRKKVLSMVPKAVRKNKRPARSPNPIGLYLMYDDITLDVEANFEENALREVRRAADRHDKATAERVAQMILSGMGAFSEQD